jgi:2-amino-4-hydroxy-6-hydroxymethyldihydropteridine diphosphokinase
MYNYFLGLGSNIEPRLFYMQQAVDRAASLGQLQRKSALYQTQAWGRTDQDEYYNAVIQLHCSFDGEKLLTEIKKIEKDLGREAGIKWGPRTIDIDILWSDGPSIQKADLQIPHPLLKQRLFVLQPLSEITDMLILDNASVRISHLLTECEDKSKVVKLNFVW